MNLSIKVPKNTNELAWTRHSLEKMLFYRLSEGRVRRVLKSPTRKEEGIASGTLAVMQRNDKPRRKEEVWVMYKEGQISNHESSVSRKAKRIIISAWRYPGVSPKGKDIPMPEDIREYLNIF